MRRFATPILLLLAAAALAGCQQVFTTSIGTIVARESVVLPATLSAAEAAELAARAKSNEDTELASALVSTLTAQVGSTVTAANASLAASAASSAVVASGAGSVVMTALDSFLGEGVAPTGQAVIDIVTAIQDGVTPGILDALMYLDPATGIADPSSVSGTVNATDYAMAAIVLAVNALPAGFEDPSTLSGADLTNYRADPDVVVALALIDAAEALTTDASGLELLGLLSSMVIPEEP